VRVAVGFEIGGITWDELASVKVVTIVVSTESP